MRISIDLFSLNFNWKFQEYVCGEKNAICSWGRAINVANRYVYVTQPDKDRILVISKIQMVVVDVSQEFFSPVTLNAQNNWQRKKNL